MTNLSGVSDGQPVAGCDDQKRQEFAKEDYVHRVPEGDVRPSQHFSNLLFSGDLLSTAMELALLVGLTSAAVLLPVDTVNVRGSMPLLEVAAFFWCTSIVTRVYNSYLEACYFAFPQYRTQPPSDHALIDRKDLCGRDRVQLERLVLHDRLTMLSQFAFGVLVYYCLPGYYPAAEDVKDSLPVRVAKLALNHYLRRTSCPSACTGAIELTTSTPGSGRTCTRSTTGPGTRCRGTRTRTTGSRISSIMLLGTSPHRSSAPSTTGASGCRTFFASWRVWRSILASAAT
ncbi:unnamed protein product [Prorocentrum cordatum]|uniref:Uncharacterized protein n=1 Tax=Prorocentrum cordatum TaxID=2364126 RepID=A0ABN9VJB3_9DINO|nr:unnamed protein product [Polarella glacialis]